VLGVSRAGFYAWQSRPLSARAAADQALLERIRQIHQRRRATYGAPRIHAELRLDHGVHVSRQRVARLMRIHHSDQGCQYTSLAFGRRCRGAGITPSMGSVGDCFDNAMAESFFATLDCELLDRHRSRTRIEARVAVFDYLEGFYNPHRRHSALGQLSPTNYERNHQPACS
jgi:transposase InsO family protein